MASQLTFIHAADLHIGAPFRGLGNLSSRWADFLIDAIPAAFDRIVDEAISREVDFVIIAGDVFDDARASYADYAHFFQGLEKLGKHNIPVYLCTGNHDPYASWQQDFFALPKNAFMFSAEHSDFALYERDGEPLCVLGGRGFLNSVWSDDSSIAEGITRENAIKVLGERAQAAPFGVGVLHTGLDMDEVKAPASRSELLEAGFDYWSLGHIHKRFVDDENNPRMSFSGDIQGRDIKETGRRGVNLVTLTQGEPNRIEFIPTASVAWEQFELNVESCENVSDIAKELKHTLFDINKETRCEKMITRVTLCGKTPLHSKLSQQNVLDDIRDEVNNSYSEFFIDTIVDKTTSPLDREALRAEGLFPATFLRVADDICADETRTGSYIQEEIIKRHINAASKEALTDITELAEEAESLTLDLLMHEEA